MSNYEVANDLRALAEKIISKLPELSYILESDIQIGYIRSHEDKKGSKVVFADCRKVTGPYKVFIDYDFLITFYEKNTCLMTENQKKILMLHELKHIGVDENGKLVLSPHDTEDFRSILDRFGVGWADFNNSNVIDILGEGESKDASSKTEKQKGRKRQNLGAESNSGKNGGTPSKSRRQKDKG